MKIGMIQDLKKIMMKLFQENENTSYNSCQKSIKKIKKKNILKLGNKPLVQITIEFAKKIKDVFDIIVSTDDQEIIKICNKNYVKAPFKRPNNLSDHKASTYSVCEHAIKFYEKILSNRCYFAFTTYISISIFEINKFVNKYFKINYTIFSQC